MRTLMFGPMVVEKNNTIILVSRGIEKWYKTRSKKTVVTKLQKINNL